MESELLNVPDKTVRYNYSFDEQEEFSSAGSAQSETDELSGDAGETIFDYKVNSLAEHELTATQAKTAVELNERYKKLYKWEGYIPSILKQIGVDPTQFPGIMADPKKFAQAFAQWQERNGYKGTQKGVFGLTTWTYFQKRLGLHNLSNRHNINVEKAVSTNKHYEGSLWGNKKDEIYNKLFINKVINSPAVVLNDEYFAYAIADFQALKGLKADGILGPGTFDLIQKTVPATPSIPPVTLTPSYWHKYIPDAVQSPAEPLVNGKEAFREMVKVIKTAKEKGHFIYLLSGWVADVDFCLSPNEDKVQAGIDTSSSLRNLLMQANKDVEIKILSWNNPRSLTELAKGEKFINELRASGKNALMLRDNFTYGTEFIRNLMTKVRAMIKSMDLMQPALNRFDFWKDVKAKADAFPNQGSHHEKILVVNGTEGLIAFCGGMDINSDRVIGLKGFCCGSFYPTYDCDLEEDSNKKMRSRILHDVHCKLKGRAAEVLLQRFIDRWNLHLSQYPQSMPRMADHQLKPIVPMTADTPYVKVLHTFNHPVNKSIKDRSIINTVESIIGQAKKSIVIEDQYMISPEIARWLNRAVHHNKSLQVCLYTQDDEFAGGDLMFPHYFRNRFRKFLYEGLDREELGRIKTFMLDPVSDPPKRRRVHSKTYIIDEELAIIGSANCNRRSMTFDSETSIVLFQDGDPSQSIVKKLSDKIRGDQYNTWIEYKPNFEKEALDWDVRVQMSPYFLAPVTILSVGAGIAAPISAQNFIVMISAFLREIIDPHPENEPIITKEVETELAEINFESDAELIQQPDPSTMNTIGYESSPLYETDNISRFSYDNEEQFLSGHCSCHKKTAEYEDKEREVAEVIENQVAVINKPCEGHTCWAKSVLNKQAGVSLGLNNTLDEATKKAIADFQLRNNLPQTRKIDAVTERALLEADALQRSKGTVGEAAAISVISAAKTKIEDWTSKAVNTKPQYILDSYRDPGKLWAFVLHQMAFKRKGRTSNQYSDPTGYLATGAHFCIMLDGRIIQLHPMSRMIWHGNCVSPRSVAVEFEGNFPNIKGKWWIDTKSNYQNKDIPTQAQYDAGRFLASYLKVVLGTTHILAHRQSSDSRENDPGPDIWYNVGQWAMDKLGLTDGGPNFKCGTGNPILPEWRTWGNKTGSLVNKEYADMEEEIEAEDEWNGRDTEVESLAGEDSYSDQETENANQQYANEEYTYEEAGGLYEMDSLTQDWSKAIQQNRYYSEHLGWNRFHDQVNDLILPYSGQKNVSLGEEAFAQAVAAWQQQQGFAGKDCDGVIGPKTWSLMQSSISGIQPVQSSPNRPSWVAELTPLLNKYRGDIPLDFLLGWITIESGGRIGVVTRLNERGYFQIHPDESKALKLLSHERLSTDPEYSIASGIALVRYLGLKAKKYAQQLNIAEGSDLYWHLVKLLHWLPGGVKLIVEDMVARGVKPSTWNDFKTDVLNRSDAIKEAMRRRLGKVWEPSQGINNVEKLFKEAARLGSTEVTTPTHQSGEYEDTESFKGGESANAYESDESFEDSINSELRESFNFINIFKKD